MMASTVDRQRAVTRLPLWPGRNVSLHDFTTPSLGCAMLVIGQAETLGEIYYT